VSGKLVWYRLRARERKPTLIVKMLEDQNHWRSWWFGIRTFRVYRLLDDVINENTRIVPIVCMLTLKIHLNIYIDNLSGVIDTAVASARKRPSIRAWASLRLSSSIEVIRSREISSARWMTTLSSVNRRLVEVLVVYVDRIVPLSWLQSHKHDWSR
jgi:hypothetical protein